MLTRKSFTLFAAGAFSLALGYGCQSGGKGNDDSAGSGGEGGEGEGGDGSEAGRGGAGADGGSGGKGAAGGAGKGGNGTGGSGGSGDTGGSGGQSGGTGGSSGGQSGGSMIGQLTCTPPWPAGTPDAQIPKDAVLCEPSCIYRPNWPGHHTCGPAGSVYKEVAMKSDGVCGMQYNKDGVFEIPQGWLDGAAFMQAPNTNGEVNPNIDGVRDVYLPGGPAGYAAAKDGEVAVSFWLGGFTSTNLKGTHRIANIHEYLVAQKHIPYTIAVFVSEGGDFMATMKKLTESTLPALIGRYGKISKNPDYRVIAGQSTTAGWAFDAAWLFTNSISKAIGGGSSVVCFTCMGGLKGANATNCNDGANSENLAIQSTPECQVKNSTYVKEIQFCPARPIRWTSAVGGCDIAENNAARKAAGCQEGSGDGAIDGSECGATWRDENEKLTAALKAKGMPHQLFVVKGGGHAPANWSYALPWQLRWAFKDITCKQ